MLIFLALALLTIIPTVQSIYSISAFWTTSDCTGTPSIWSAVSLNTPCTPSCSTTNFGNFKSASISCSQDPPSFPDGIQGWSVYTDSSSCLTNPATMLGYGSNCLNYSSLGGMRSFRLTCGSNGLHFETFTGSGDCTGAKTDVNYDYGCVGAAGASINQVSCGSPACFHEDTVITYNGRNHKMAAFSDHPDCVIPHVVKRDGLRIYTSCGPRPLRLTEEHLLDTQDSWMKASDLKVGDFLFQNDKVCEVKSIEKDIQQTYFGLNCKESVVRADGYRTSTFGHYHVIPALWMKVMSTIFGIDTASAWGESIVFVLSTFELL